MRTWSGQNHSLSGFEKIRMVGKGAVTFLLFTYVITNMHMDKLIAERSATFRSEQQYVSDTSIVL